MTWQDHAACVNADQALFFPQPGTVGLEAKAICAGCPVRAECLEYALDTGEDHGVWGGLTVRERKRLRRPFTPWTRPNPIRNHGTDAGYAAHRYRGEPACDACRQAHSLYTRLARPALRRLPDPSMERHHLAGMSPVELRLLEAREVAE